MYVDVSTRDTSWWSPCGNAMSVIIFCVIGSLIFFFFFQAEDGIRDLTVTGVQTCALPICTQINSVYIREQNQLLSFELNRDRGSDSVGVDIENFSLGVRAQRRDHRQRSEEHTSELHHSQISYAVFCLKKKKKKSIKNRKLE